MSQAIREPGLASEDRREKNQSNHTSDKAESLLRAGVYFSNKLRTRDSQPITELVPRSPHCGEVPLPETRSPTCQHGTSNLREDLGQRGPLTSLCHSAASQHLPSLPVPAHRRSAVSCTSRWPSASWSAGRRWVRNTWVWPWFLHYGSNHFTPTTTSKPKNELLICL